MVSGAQASAEDSPGGIYLYCLARGTSLPAAMGPGMDGHRAIRQWAFRDVVGVFCKVDIEAWTGPSAEANLQDLSWVGPRACRHAEVIGRVMQHSPVLPARFGTLFTSLQSLEDLLQSHYDRASEFLEYVAGKEEWGIKGLLDKAKAEAWVLASDSRIPGLSASSGARYLQQQRLRAEAGKKLKSWVKTVGAAIKEELQVETVDFRTLKPLAPGTSGRGGHMSFNWAFLVEQEGREAFRARVQEINAEHSRRALVLELTGPWPPYSFCPSFE